MLPLGNSLTWPGQDDVEVHAEDTSVGVVLDTQVDVLLNAKAEVSYSW